MVPSVAKEFMVKRVITLRPEMDVHEAVRLLLKNRISGAPVVDPSGRYLGVFSEKCCMGAIIDSAYEQLPTRDVGSFMDTEAQTIAPDTQLLSIAQLFLLTPYRRLPVVDEDGKLQGQISRRDVIKAASDLLEPAAQRETSILYLSALVNREDSPIT